MITVYVDSSVITAKLKSNTEIWDNLDIFHHMQVVVNWCKENCTDQWIWASLYVFKFVSEEDAMYFKIVWA